MDGDALERAACTPYPVDPKGFNPTVQLPYGLAKEHIYLAMVDFIDFLGLVNNHLYTKEIQRLETLLMPANFSSVVANSLAPESRSIARGW